MADIEYYSLVTGSSSGIGKSIAEELAKRNHNVLLVSLPGQDLDKIAGDIKNTLWCKNRLV